MTTETQQLSVAGLLEIGERGFGFLRDPKVNFRARTGDPFVTARLIEDAGLDEGLLIEGGADEPAAADRRTGRGPQLVSIRHINGVEASVWKPDVPFAELVSIDPEDPFRLARGPDDLAMRVVELVAPIGHGQRGLIVAPPKSGKTTLIEQLATGFSENHPDVDLLVVLIDERPEEVTHLKRTIRGEVVASTSDEDTEVQLRLARLMLERAKRLVEAGRHVVLLLDSITRFGRASNRGQAGRGRTMSGGIDTRALEFPRKFFGAARNAEDGGSLTILATAIVGSGSQMDEVIFQEFKGTGNMEIILDRQIAERRIFPAVDVLKSGTRREELLMTADDLRQRHTLRRALAEMSSIEAAQFLNDRLSKTQTNRGFLETLVPPPTTARRLLR